MDRQRRNHTGDSWKRQVAFIFATAATPVQGSSKDSYSMNDEKKRPEQTADQYLHPATRLRMNTAIPPLPAYAFMASKAAT
jgi:hypothetical protein